MKKYIIFTSLFLIGLFCWFYNDNDPYRVAEKKQYQSKKEDSKKYSQLVATQLQKKKPERLPSSNIKKKITKRTWKFKDYSRLPAKYSGNKTEKKVHQKLHNHLRKIQEEYFKDTKSIETPIGTFLISKQLKAILKDKYEQRMGLFYTEHNQHVLFKNEENIDLNNFNPRGPSLVTINKSSGKMGILTGKIIVELDPKSIIDGLISQYHLDLIFHSESINTYYLELTTPGNLEEIIQGLRSDKAVIRADLEVIENIPIAL